MSLEVQFSEIKNLITQARNRAYQAVNNEAILLNWRVGEYVSDKLKSASWGDGVVAQLSDFLKLHEPSLKGFTKRGIYRMVQFYDTYSNPEFVVTVTPQLKLLENSIVSTVLTQIESNENQLNVFVSTVLTQIAWSNHLEILVSCKTADEKLFYILMTKKERWSVRDLRRQIKASTFERTMLGNQQVEQIQKHIPQEITNVFRDTYVFEFLDIPELHTEQTLRKTLLKNLSSFMKELGNDFLFVGEEFKVSVGMQDFFIDLLFYHRDLQCLVAFELKTEIFTPQSLAQINFYLEALDRDVKKPNENPSIGILLCKGKDDLVVEYALSRSLNPAMIADYQLKLPNKELLQAKWLELIEMSEKNGEI
jgi:predicted nuclease of restriction endonuclease-like (RecB) superfamily